MPNRTLDEVGLGGFPQTLLYLISLLPLVGLVIGLSYAIRRNAATRQLGRRLFAYAVFIHLIYGFCICPLMVYGSL